MAGQGIAGIFVFLGVAWLLSENRRAVQKRDILLGLGLQVGLAVIITQFPLIRYAFESLSKGVEVLKHATQAGTQFVFGYLGGGAVPFTVTPDAGASTFIFALQALPTIMVVSALSMLLFHWQVLPAIVRLFSLALQRTLRIGGALGVVAASKVFLGNLEAPLLVRPYLKNFSRCELFTVMTCGMATTAASVMALYTSILEGTVANPIAHILTASIISIPAAITLSRIMVPHEGVMTSGTLVAPYKFSNWMDAVSRGTSDGLTIFLHVMAMLIVALALVSLLNALLACLPTVGGEAITMQRLLGYIMAPVTWLMGIPWEEAPTAGKLLGTKTALNEVVAFLELSKLTRSELSAQSALIMTYALCGFANFSAIGIMIGGIGSMVPERRDEIVALGVKSVFAGTLATCLSGTVIGLLAQLSGEVIK
ncbi:MAG: nucleoside:proton symporter [Alphaproteobacteria bacterium]|jgi:CNT family concentrative nucleoside transporter|nr:nucleoside:proton symporter [Alphaproteobacteria bacterium]